MLNKVIAQQLGNPFGLLGRVVTVIMNSANKQMNRASVTALHLQGDHRVLDIGFGGGIALEMMSSEVNDGTVVGMEMSDTALRQARHKFRRQMKDGRIELVKGAIESMPFLKDEFDRVTTVNTIYFWKDVEKSMAEIYRILKPNGEVVIGFRPVDEMKKLGFTKHGFKLHDNTTVLSSLRDSGFRNVHLMIAHDGHLGFNCAAATKAA